MPQPMKPTLRLVPAVVALVLVLAACTDEGAGGRDTNGVSGATGASGEPSPTISVAPGASVYLYANAGLVVKLDLDALTMEVDNGTGRALPKPDFYVLRAKDGSQVDGRVVDAAAIPAGETASFAVELGDVASQNIGLVVLLVGGDNYGAFVRQ